MGVLHKGRNDLGEEREKFAVERGDITLEKAMKDADVFLGT
jgi:malate dehydrogenase (oxaloacetate-decarboxylating)(NADP+)